MYIEKSYNHWSADSTWLIPNTTASARKMLYYIQEAGDFTTYSKYYTERENLNSFLIAYTLSGEGKLTYQDNEYLLEPGSVFFINCMDYQLYKNASDTPWHFLWIHFNGCSSLAYFEEFIKNGSPVISIPQSQKIEEPLHAILRYYQHRDYQTEFLVSHAIESLLTELVLTSYHSRLPDNTDSSRANQIMKYIDKHYAEKITLDDLSNRFAQNKYTLQKDFKKAVGITPTAYMISCRLSQAKVLLQYSDLTVNEISYKVGIENVSHFINLFKKQEGMTPASFRKIW